MITIIAAVAADGAIGRKGDLLWHLRGDLRRFKSLTMGSPVIMGRLTWESLPKRPLPGRLNIVVSRNPDYEAPGAIVSPDLQSAIREAGKDAAPDCFIIGGGTIYAEAMPLAEALELTEIDATAPDADTFFPEIADDEWKKVASLPSEENGLSYAFTRYERIIPSSRTECR